MMYTALDPVTQETFDFRKLPALVRRLGGTEYQVEHETAFEPPQRTIMILRPNAKAGGKDVLRRVRVPSRAVKAAAAEVEAR